MGSKKDIDLVPYILLDNCKYIYIADMNYKYINLKRFNDIGQNQFVAKPLQNYIVIDIDNG